MGEWTRAEAQLAALEHARDNYYPADIAEKDAKLRAAAAAVIVALPTFFPASSADGGGDDPATSNRRRWNPRVTSLPSQTCVYYKYPKFWRFKQISHFGYLRHTI